jgi:hypothetical protein
MGQKELLPPIMKALSPETTPLMGFPPVIDQITTEPLVTLSQASPSATFICDSKKNLECLVSRKTE